MSFHHDGETAAGSVKIVAPKKADTTETLTIDGREVRVTHPEKPYFTKQVKVSKLELVRYYLSVAPGALNGIRDRPIVLKRFRRRRRPGVLSETCAGKPAHVVAHCHPVVSVRT